MSKCIGKKIYESPVITSAVTLHGQIQRRHKYEKNELKNNVLLK